ncbi:MAG: hypothetical protein HY646_01790 [Acidobacteria bacterium]|nr:hypothetical protein [Acidobacteriota bacterium]
MAFREYLHKMGDKFNCYFTVESVGHEGSVNNPILDTMVEYQPVDTLESLLGSLAKTRLAWKFANETNLIELAVHKVSRDSPIIRLRDKRLASVTNYALNERISIEYSGTPDGLIGTISELIPTIEHRRLRPVTIGVPLAIDAQTQVRVSVIDKPVGDVLTECIPPAGYRRIIWSSYTDGKKDSPTVTVTFYGPKPPPLKEGR